MYAAWPEDEFVHADTDVGAARVDALPNEHAPASDSSNLATFLFVSYTCA